MTNSNFIIATQNQGKFKECVAYFKDLPVTFKSLADYPDIGPIAETGVTFKENALIKARAVHQVTGGFVLADDSGLECDDLGGDPGVYSARFAGEKATDEENNAKLISMLKGIHDPSRQARYVCSLILIDPQGQVTHVEDTCEGMITFSPSGDGGFGYDPYFFLPDKQKTMAEIDLAEKNQISHRGKALQKISQLIHDQFRS